MSPTLPPSTPLADREPESARLSIAVEACAAGRSTVVEVRANGQVPVPHASSRPTEVSRYPSRSLAAISLAAFRAARAGSR